MRDGSLGAKEQPKLTQNAWGMFETRKSPALVIKPAINLDRARTQIRESCFTKRLEKPSRGVAVVFGGKRLVIGDAKWSS